MPFPGHLCWAPPAQGTLLHHPAPRPLVIRAESPCLPDQERTAETRPVQAALPPPCGESLQSLKSGICVPERRVVVQAEAVYHGGCDGVAFHQHQFRRVSYSQAGPAAPWFRGGGWP